MSQNVERYYIPGDGPDNVPIKKGIFLLDELSKKYGSRDAILFIPTKRNIEGTSLESAIGTDVSKALLKGQKVKLPSGGTLKLETEKTFHNLSTDDIIFGVYVDKKMLDKIDSVKNTPAVIVVPWVENIDIKEWVRAWNPEIPGKKQTATIILLLGRL